jgi:hypothetical protein
MYSVSVGCDEPPITTIFLTIAWDLRWKLELGGIKGDAGWREILRERSFEPRDLQRQVKYAQDGVGNFQSQLVFDHCTVIIIVVIRPCPSQGRRSQEKFLALNFEIRGGLGIFLEAPLPRLDIRHVW